MSNIKRFVFPVIFAAVGLALLIVPSVGVTQFVELPTDVSDGINALILLAVSWAIGQIIILIPFFKFLDEFRIPLSSAIALALIQWMQTTTPDNLGPIVVQSLRLVLLVIGLFLTFYRLKEKGVQAFQ